MKLNFILVIFKLILIVDGWGTPFHWTSLIGEGNGLVLSRMGQCWPSYMSPYVVTKPEAEEVIDLSDFHIQELICLMQILTILRNDFYCLTRIYSAR